MPLRSLVSESINDNSIEEYSSSLTPRQERDQIKEELGFKVESKLKKVIKTPLRKIRKFAKRAVAGKKQPGALILVRGGESEFSKNFTWTGWLDPPLTPAGYLQVCLSRSYFYCICRISKSSSCPNSHLCICPFSNDLDGACRKVSQQHMTIFLEALQFQVLV